VVRFFVRVRVIRHQAEVIQSAAIRSSTRTTRGRSKATNSVSGTDAHLALPFPDLQVFDAQRRRLADSQARLQQELYDGVVAARQRPAGLAGGTQQSLDLHRQQCFGARAPRRPRKLQLGGHVGAQFAGRVCPAAEAAQGFELAIDAGRSPNSS
jgi:hypothetical protein